MKNKIFRKKFYIKNSHFINEKKDFNLIIKIFNPFNRKIKKQLIIQEITMLTKNYIEFKKEKANIKELFHKIFNSINYFVTYEVKNENNLLKNNTLYIQIIIL